MKFPQVLLWPIGIFFIFLSVISMLFYHEFLLSSITFIMGIIMAGFAYAKFPDKPKINTDQANKNLQAYNDLLWGKEKERDSEEIITISIKKKK